MYPGNGCLGSSRNRVCVPVLSPNTSADLLHLSTPFQLSNLQSLSMYLVRPDVLLFCELCFLLYNQQKLWPSAVPLAWSTTALSPSAAFVALKQDPMSLIWEGRVIWFL